MAQESQNGMHGALSSKSDYIGGIFDRWINIIPESIIFNKYFLPAAVKASERNAEVSVISDFYKYDPKKVGIAPDVLGLKINGRAIPFVKYDDSKARGDYWQAQSGCPQIEVKSFFGNKYMVSLRDQNYGDKFLVMAGVSLAVDYLLPFFNKTIFNEDQISKLEMPDDFIVSNAKGLLSQTQRITFDKTDLGSLELLAVTTASAFRDTALELQGGDEPKYLVDIIQRRQLIKDSAYTPNQTLNHYCDKQPSGLHRFNNNWRALFPKVKEKTLDIYVENPENLLIIKKMSNSIAVFVLADSKVNEYSLKKGNQYNINFGTFGSIAGKEYFLSKSLLKYLPNKEDDLLEAIVEVIKNN
jgi:hypothetical protein